MRYIDGFRSGAAAAAISEEIRVIALALEEKGASPRIMEVCGSHTMSIGRYGIRRIMPGNVSLLSGPGCPVCVTDAAYIDAAVELARRGVVIATFGDMLKVPGSSSTLADARSQGARVHVCYSPLEAVKLAGDHPGDEVVFLGIGFETTVAPVLSIVKRASEGEVRNISVLTAFKLVPPALEALAADSRVAVNGFLLPAHVSAVIGSDAYRGFVDAHRLPSVIAGFEPLDILLGIKGLLQQLADGSARLENQYTRVVRPGGNPLALALMEKYLQPADASWRGIGTIPESGLELKEEYSGYDGGKRHGVATTGGNPDPRCRCGEVLRGVLLPGECPLMGRECTPAFPVGPCMVSSEGSCAAHYRYSR